MSRTEGRVEPKAKKSYTLSRETVAFLETVRKKRRAESVSSVLEEILQSARREFERASVERAVADYYSGLTGKEAAERAEWGEFGLAEFSKQERG